MRPILFPLSSVNHSASSGPDVIPRLNALGVGIEKLVVAPEVVTLPMSLLAPQELQVVSHKAPSGPVVRFSGLLTPALNLLVIVPEVVMRSILLLFRSRNHSAPSGPDVIEVIISEPPTGSTLYSVMEPEVVILPILFAFGSINHKAPSDPAAMSSGKVFAVGMENSVILPEVVIRPMPLEPASVNQRFPSDPLAMPIGPAFAVGSVNSLIEPEVDMRPILLFWESVNHIALSGPATIPWGEELAIGYSFVMLPEVDIRPMAPPPASENQRAPSGPSAILRGSELAVGMAYSEIEPEALEAKGRKEELIMAAVASSPNTLRLIMVAPLEFRSTLH
jgi:hypothetical protein